MASDQAAAIGRRLRERREELGWTRRRLAKETDGLATDNDIYRWESGKHRPQDDTLTALARAMGKSYAWALGEEERKATKTPEPYLNGNGPSLEEQILARLDAIEDLIKAEGVRNATRAAEALQLLEDRLPPSAESQHQRPA